MPSPVPTISEILVMGLIYLCGCSRDDVCRESEHSQTDHSSACFDIANAGAVVECKVVGCNDQFCNSYWGRFSGLFCSMCVSATTATNVVSVAVIGFIDGIWECVLNQRC